MSSLNRDESWTAWDWYTAVCTFIVVIYVPYFFLAPLCRRAARVVGLDFDKYIYIPYEAVNKETKKLEPKYITVRKPASTLEWVFLTAFTIAIGGLVYKLSCARGQRRTAEAQRNLVKAYKKYVKLGMFAILFPLGCKNEASAISEFCTHISLYYRTVTGITDMLGDISDVVCDASDWMCEEAVVAPVEVRVVEAKPKAPKERVGCVHMNDCPAKGHVGSDWTKPCHTACGGHHCVHFATCDPEHYEDDEAKHDQTTRHPQMDKDEHEPALGHVSPEPELEIEEEDVEMVEHAHFINRPKTDEEREIAAESSRINFEKLIADEEEARAKLLRGETHFGLGYARDSKKLSGIWRRLKANTISMFNLTISTTMIGVYYAYNFVKIYSIRYKWWLLGGVGVAAGAFASYKVYNAIVRNYDSDSEDMVIEGGKKRNRAGKKDRADMKNARSKISTNKPPVHPPSSDPDDENVNWRQRAEERERENEEAEREHIDLMERIDDKFARGEESSTKKSVRKMPESKHNPVSCTREELLKMIRETQLTWFEKGDTDNIKARRAKLQGLFVILNERFPKERKEEEKSKKPEQLRPGKLPITTPAVYLIKAYYAESDEPGYTCGFPYANSLYVPRHGVSGASKVVLVNGSKEIDLPDKCVLMRDATDQVMYPLPAGLRQNKKMQFRAPKKGELVTLFWVRKSQAGVPTYCVGTVGDTHHLGKDRALETVEFDGSSEDGSCGGFYIASSDGYCVGFHGIGADVVSKAPEFYPVSSKWVEALAKASKQLPTYLNLEDSAYFNKLNKVMNGQLELSGLNY